MRNETIEKKRSLGQHFLRSEKALSQIRDAADSTGVDVVLEIGPGEGVLTKTLLFFAGKVIAVEKDKRLIPILQEKFSKEIREGKLDLIEKDILEFDPEVLRLYERFDYEVVANIPYYITGAILEKFLSSTYQPKKMVLLIQKEVAERIVARNKKESILSISVKVYGKPKIVAKVPRGAFVPPPTVDSAIISIEDINREFFKDCDEGKFFSVLKAVFGKKRNQLSRSLGEYLGNKEKALEIINSIDLNPKIRPEDMTLFHWKKLTKCIMSV